jgi:ABC-type multidrug transport system fused ATPase/permease subunit
MQHLTESFGSIKDIKLFNGYSNFKKLFDKNAEKYSNSYQSYEFINSLPKILIEFFVIFLFIITIGVMSVLKYNNNQIIIYTSLFAVVGFKFIPSLNKIILALSHLKFYLPLSSSIIKDLQLKKTVHKKNYSKINFEKKIFLKKISFAYDKKINVIKNLNLIINKNDIIGIQGETGVGKSTFINILLGLLSPTSGSCEVDGVTIDFANENWQKKIGYVPQNVYLLDDTIKKNVAFGIENSKIDEEKVISALKISQSFNFIKKLPKFINSSVGEKGLKFSGGQIQRIGIARALYNDPDILIFDEPSNSLDKKTEVDLIVALDKLKKNKTVIIVSHTRQILKICNKIYKLKKGKFVNS